MKSILTKQSFIYLLLAVLVIIVFFPLVVGTSVMKWDAMDLYLPWKYYATESLKDGYLPLWNPSLNGGFPQMGDPGTWYPISWILALLTKGYGIYTTQLEYLFHLLIAGIGMYRLLHSKMEVKASAFVGASVFLLSGVFISNAQHIGWIVGASWLPWILLYFQKLLNGSKRASIYLAMVLFLQLSGGYPAIFFITAYIILFILIRFLFLNRKDLKSKLSSLSISGSLFLVLFLAVSGLVIYASFDMANHVNRGASLSSTNGIWNLLVGSLEPQSFVSFITPLVTIKNDNQLWGFDISMTNVFIGAVILIALVSQICSKSANKNIRWYTIAALLFFGLALGNLLPLRSWITHLPLLDTFRFPSLFRLFGDFFLIIAASYALKEIRNSIKAQKNFFITSLIAFTVFTILALILFSKAERWKFKSLITEGYQQFLNTAGVLELGLLQLLVLLFFIAIILLSYKLNKQRFHLIICSISIIEISTATILHRSITVMEQRSVELASQGLENNPKQYEIPQLLPMQLFQNDTLKDGFTYLWRNIPIYKKVPSHDGHSPYSLLTQLEALKKGYDTIALKSPVLYFVKEEEFNKEFEEIDTKWDLIQITDFNPNRIVATMREGENGYLIFNQNIYPHWQARVNKKHATIIPFKGNYMAIKVSKDTKSVAFTFNPPLAKSLFFLSITTFIVLLGLILFWGIKKEK